MINTNHGPFDTSGWPATLDEARRLQLRWASRVEARDRFDAIQTVAGVDCGYGSDRRALRVGVCVFSYPGLELLETMQMDTEAGSAYRPGHLAFREGPAMLRACSRLNEPPDLLVCDGHGTAHPRGFGLACLLGVVLDMPAIGIAKDLLAGEYEPPGRERGSWTPLVHKGMTVGAVLRTRTGVKPLFVSPGHRVGLASAMDITLTLAPRYRQTEVIRCAHSRAALAP